MKNVRLFALTKDKRGAHAISFLPLPLPPLLPSYSYWSSVDNGGQLLECHRVLRATSHGKKEEEGRREGKEGNGKTTIYLPYHPIFLPYVPSEEGEMVRKLTEMRKVRR